MAIRVTALSTTPIKGLRIAARERLALERDGARGDRRFYLIDTRGRMINGKHSGSLSEVVAELAEEGPAGEALTLTFPDGRSLSGGVELGEAVATTFFSRPRAARLVRGEFSRALSTHTGQEIRLVSAADGSTAIDRGELGAVTLISRSSLARLAEVAGEARIDARRFRTTIEVDGVEAFAEDAWVGGELGVGDAVLRLHGHVGRCIVTTRHPETGVVDLPTLDVLRSFRAGAPTSEPLAFGVYGEVLRAGTVALGQELSVTLLGSTR